MRRLLCCVIVLVFVGASCSGEVATSTGSDADETNEQAAATAAPTDTPAPADTGSAATTDTEEQDDAGGETATSDPEDTPDEDPVDDGPTWSFPTHDDPRDGIFDDFQATMVRDSPFESLDAFCLAHPAAENRVATDPGITADTIEIHHARNKLEDAAAIGFGIDVGDVANMFEVFVDTINNECGGIRGRMLDLGTSEYSPLDPDTAATTQLACLEATEDRNAVAVLNTTGFQGAALLCITEEHETALLTTQGVSDSYYERGGGRLISMDEGLEEGMRLMVQVADRMGALDGASIGVIAPDTPGLPDAIEQGIIAEIEALGHEVAVYEILECSGGSSCSGGLDTAVASLIDEDVTVVFPPLNILSLPSLIAEMSTQGFEPGDIQFFNGKPNSQDGDLVSSKVAAFGGQAAAELYNGATLVSSGATGNFQFVDEVPRFNQLCIDTYAAGGGGDLRYFDRETNTPQGMLAGVCSQFRLLARAIYDAGDNPTRADIFASLADIGPFDFGNMMPTGISAGDSTAAGAVQTLTFSYPCSIPDGAYDNNDTCVVQNQDWVLIE